MEPNRYRRWIKSKVFSGKDHGVVQSSISKDRFAGTQEGWIGERSVPMTVV